MAKPVHRFGLTKVTVLTGFTDKGYNGYNGG